MRLDHKAKGPNGPRVAIMWESLDEPAAEVQRRMKGTDALKMVMQHVNGQSAVSKPERWFGAPSFAEYRNRLENGWPEGVERLLKLSAREVATAQDVRRRRVRGDQGDELDMQAVYRGDLSRAWTRTRRMSRVHQRNVNIICAVGDHANISAETLFWRGAAALRLAVALDAAGFNVGIYAGESGRQPGGFNGKKAEYAQFVEIKASDMPLDLSRLAALTCMSGYFRTSFFAGIAVAANEVGDTVDQSFGWPNHEILGDCAEQIGLVGCIVQPAINDEASATAWVDAMLVQVQEPLAA